VVRGYVQGVGFRAFVAREGRRLCLAGTARNRADGAVEVVAEGERDALEALLQAVHRGPGEAEVEHVEAQWGPAQGRLPGFEISY
jgi:acylphosphatase